MSLDMTMHRRCSKAIISRLACGDLLIVHGLFAAFHITFLSNVGVLHNILEPTVGVTFFNSGFKSDPTELWLQE